MKTTTSATVYEFCGKVALTVGGDTVYMEAQLAESLAQALALAGGQVKNGNHCPSVEVVA